MKFLQLEVVVVVALLATALAAAAKPPSNPLPGPEEFAPPTVLSLPWH